MRTGWRDSPDYDVDRIYTKTHTQILSRPHLNTQQPPLKLPFCFKTDVHISSFSFTHKYSYFFDLGVNAGLRKDALPLPPYVAHSPMHT